MQSSGNTNLLKEAQRNALIDLSSDHEQLQIIIEKLISSALDERDLRNKQLGYSDDFFDKLGKTASEKNKLQWFIHQHLNFDRVVQLYESGTGMFIHYIKIIFYDTNCRVFVKVNNLNLKKF